MNKTRVSFTVCLKINGDDRCYPDPQASVCIYEFNPPPPAFEQVARHPSGWEAVRCSNLDSMWTQNVLFWQRQGGAAIRQAAWELVVEAWKAQNRNPDERRFQRTAPVFRKA